MIYEFRLPDIGEGVVEGEVVRWLVSEGEPLREDQPMVEIMTDKATVEIPAPRAGRVGKRMYAEGQLCPVGKVLITIELDGDAAAGAGAAKSEASAETKAEKKPEKKPEARSETRSETPAAAHGHASSSSQPSSSQPSSSQPSSPSSPSWQSSAPSSAPASFESAGHGNGTVTKAAAVLATPATRKLARDTGVDLRQVVGTGPAGRITSLDVKEHQPGGGGPATSQPPSPPSARPPATIARDSGDVRLPFRGLRKKIAENMVRSKQTAAHFTYVEEIDCTDLVKLRQRANQRLHERGVKLSFLPFIIKATVAALQRFPQMNAALDEAAGEIVQRRSYHIGLATATAAGLIVPVVRDADRRSLVDLGQEIDRLAEATRTGKATREELGGSTFTITSLGALGGVLATPIINFPEVAILGVHKIAKRPAVSAAGTEVVIRDLMNLSISVDHRVVDGYDAARFVAEIKLSLETPGLLFLESV
jgi:pyruvate dehydrogenase E2 component (dihydrolipoamide acetyltransferase)